MCPHLQEIAAFHKMRTVFGFNLFENPLFFLSVCTSFTRKKKNKPVEKEREKDIQILFYS